jgi:hypothetical protein
VQFEKVAHEDVFVSQCGAIDHDKDVCESMLSPGQLIRHFCHMIRTRKVPSHRPSHQSSGVSYGSQLLALWIPSSCPSYWRVIHALILDV